MDLGTQISLDIVVSLISGIIGAVGAYVKLKSKIDVLESKSESQETEITSLKESKKEMNALLHKRIDEQSKTIATMQRELTTGHSKLETAMTKMELRIVKEIQNLVKHLNK
jgi:septal ring factor EnvC (AmiA/AmiB activator)